MPSPFATPPAVRPDDHHRTLEEWFFDRLAEAHARYEHANDSFLVRLGELFGQTVNTRPIGTGHTEFLTIDVPATPNPPIEVLSTTLDRAALYVLNISDTTIALGGEQMSTPSNPNRFDLPPGVGISTGSRDRIFAVCSVAGKQLAVMAEVWGPTWDAS